MKRISNLIVLTAAILSFSLTAHAAPKKSQYTQKYIKFMTVASIEVQDVTDKYDQFSNKYEYNILSRNWISNPIDDTLNKADFIVDKIINIGQKIWNVIDKGRPVANYASSSATALPENTTRWEQLEQWQAPRSKVINVVYKNLYGIEVIRLTYRIILLYGGSVNGVGRYIGYAAVEPLEMSTAYMYTINVKAAVNAVYNMGTKQNPVGGMLLNISWTVETVLKKSTMTHTYILDGLGNIRIPAENRIQ